MVALYKLTDDQIRVIRAGVHDDPELLAALDYKVGFPGAVAHYSELQAANEPELSAYADAASQMACVEDGVCEIDTQGPVSIVSKGEDDGAYVLAWVWVDNETAGIKSPADCDKCGREVDEVDNNNLCPECADREAHEDQEEQDDADEA